MFTRSLQLSAARRLHAGSERLRVLLVLALATLVLTPGRAAAQYITLDEPNQVYGTYPQGINNWGQIVGIYYDNTGSGVHGFLRSPCRP